MIIWVSREVYRELDDARKIMSVRFQKRYTFDAAIRAIMVALWESIPEHERDGAVAVGNRILGRENGGIEA